jgi:hypothetical protein
LARTICNGGAVVFIVFFDIGALDLSTAPHMRVDSSHHASCAHCPAYLLGLT